MRTKVTLIVKAKIVEHLDDTDNLVQIQNRNMKGCYNLSFSTSKEIQIVAVADVKINTVETAENSFEQRIDFEAVVQLAEASMRQIKRLKGSIGQVEFIILAEAELMTAEIENKLLRKFGCIQNFKDGVSCIVFL